MLIYISPIDRRNSILNKVELKKFGEVLAPNDALDVQI